MYCVLHRNGSKMFLLLLVNLLSEDKCIYRKRNFLHHIVFLFILSFRSSFYQHIPDVPGTLRLSISFFLNCLSADFPERQLYFSPFQNADVSFQITSDNLFLRIYFPFFIRRLMRKRITRLIVICELLLGLPVIIPTARRSNPLPRESLLIRPPALSDRGPPLRSRLPNPSLCSRCPNPSLRSPLFVHAVRTLR